MSHEEEKAETNSQTEKNLALFGLVANISGFVANIPTNLYAVPFSDTAPEGLALVYAAATPSEADLIRQMLLDAEFHVEYVSAITTGIFGTSGNAHVYVHADEAEEAREYLYQLQENVTEGQSPEDPV